MKCHLAIEAALATWLLAASSLLAQPGLEQPPAVAAASDENQDEAANVLCDDASCDCGSCTDGSNCGCDEGCCLCGDCCLGDAWKLQDAVAPCCEHRFGGWIAAGYYSDETGLSFFAPLNDFNDYPDHFNLDQGWVYAEKVADGNCCSADWGYRADVVYGVQAQKTQAFGNNNGSWDN
jgi:hypothetical protein